MECPLVTVFQTLVITVLQLLLVDLTLPITFMIL